MLGVKRIERVLPTGTPLTIVGEVYTLLLFIYSLTLLEEMDWQLVLLKPEMMKSEKKMYWVLLFT